MLAGSALVTGNGSAGGRFFESGDRRKGVRPGGAGWARGKWCEVCVSGLHWASPGANGACGGEVYEEPRVEAKEAVAMVEEEKKKKKVELQQLSAFGNLFIL